MPQLRRSTIVQRVVVRGGDDDYAPVNPVTPEAARLRLIRECLTELIGTPVLYAIRLPDGIIKIGHTADIKNRRKFFGAKPEDILAVLPGTYEQEQELHRQLKPSRARGWEYYHPTEQVLDVVNAMRSRLGVDALAA
jgi:hypothetical protein